MSDREVMSETALVLSIIAFLVALVSAALAAHVRIRMAQKEHEAWMSRTYGVRAQQARSGPLGGDYCDGRHPWDGGPRA